ncbi:MAG: addiction module protein [Balneolaceae bacterium]|nr:addiction module protein [Balneolaceae bacterium]
MSEMKQVLEKALKMTPAERAEIVDQLLQSLDQPDKEINKLWEKEVEDRIDAFESGDIQTVTVQEVLERHKDV